MIASLPMYDLPALQGAHDSVWDAIRARLGAGPPSLTRGGDPWDHWQSPDLLLSQTCGYPYRKHLHGRVTLVGTPDYGLPGCPAGYYNSVFIVRDDDARRTLSEFSNARLAYNDALSQSGWAAPQNHVRDLGFTFETLLRTGSHRASALMVRDGQADIAALDALTWELLQRHERLGDGLREVARTAPTPALPYITAMGRDDAALFAAIAAAIGDLDEADRDALSLRGIRAIPAAAYLEVPSPPGPKVTQGQVPEPPAF